MKRMLNQSYNENGALQLLYSPKNNMWSKSIVFVLLFAVTIVAQTNVSSDRILCTFCGWIVEDVQRQLNSSSFQDMSNRICQDVSFGLPQIETQCLQFLETQINVIISGLAVGNDATSICKFIGSCGSQASENQ
ncbi:hypothetical protein M3Y98_00242000 [Aphelenchoides besseyi]|nr:hypothetical protein M3Y98_00242000 [Aphelenchoides besseyi]KAI6200681.1 hypothetical protein M3Y96_00760000 [Aphelenchoides besseyi]